MSYQLSKFRKSAQYVLKVEYDDGSQQTVGMVTSFTASIRTGQRAIYTVDSSFPREIAQSAAPVLIVGQITMLALATTDPVKMGLVAPTVEAMNPSTKQLYSVPALSRYLKFKLYDVSTQGLVCIIDRAKVSEWTFTMRSRDLMLVSLTFEGTYYKSGFV